MPTTALTLVRGYLAGVDEIAHDAARAGLRQRFAIGFITYGPPLVESYFDRCAWRRVLEALLPLWRAHVPDAVAGALDAAAVVAAFGGDDRPGSADFAVEQVMLRTLSEPACLIRYLAYDRVGGPPPYHDCCVFEFFTASCDLDDVERRLRAICASTIEFEVFQAERSEGEPKGR